MLYKFIKWLKIITVLIINIIIFFSNGDHSANK